MSVYRDMPEEQFRVHCGWYEYHATGILEARAAMIDAKTGADYRAARSRLLYHETEFRRIRTR